MRDGRRRQALTIRDHGPGLPESSRKEIFEPYVRLAHGRESSRDGSGLGLGIARGILREHGGDVRQDNHPQRGLVATVRLPALSGDGSARRLP